MPSLPVATIKDLRARFLQDVADQLAIAARRAGLSATVSSTHERAVLEFEDASVAGTAPRIVAILNDDSHTDADERLTLYVETGEDRETLLTLAWHADTGLDRTAALQHSVTRLEASADPRLPLDRRGLNAAADVRAGRYAKADAVAGLAMDLKRAGAQAVPAEQPRALVAIEPSQPPSITHPRRLPKTEDLEAPTAQAPLAVDVETQRGNLRELLMAKVIDAMHRDLAEAESHFAGPGIGAAVRSRFPRGMEYAMLGTAWTVEFATNQTALASYLGSPKASAAFGLVGPIVIGGLAFLSKSRFGKGTAYALLIAWALTVASITASDDASLDRAQTYFSKQAAILSYEQAVAASRLTKDAADAELKRLNEPVKETSALLADARRRWLAKEIARAAGQESAKREQDRKQARQAAIDAAVALSQQELRLREALQADPSRSWAWGSLFALIAIINLLAPLAISRVLEQWRADGPGERASAREQHQKKSTAQLLRNSQPAQTTHAMLLLTRLLDDLKRNGVAPALTAGFDLAHISAQAADRFNESINPKRPARRSSPLRAPVQHRG